MGSTENWKIVEKPGRGRCLIAQQDFEENDVILVEKPYLSYQISENCQHLLVCQNCLAPVHSLASQLVRESQYDKLLMDMINVSLYHEIKNLEKQKLPLINEDQSQFSKETIQCETCLRGYYCSQECKEQDWRDFHSLLCNQKNCGFREFLDHAHDNQEIFFLACKTVFKLTILIRQNKTNEAQKFKDQVDLLCSDYSWSIIAIPDDVPVEHHENYRVMLKQMVQQSLNLLLNLLKNLKISTDNPEQIPELLQSWVTLEGYGRLLGSFIQNALCITYPNPMSEYLNILAENEEVEIEEQWQRCFNFWYHYCNKEEAPEKASSEDDESSEDGSESSNLQNIDFNTNKLISRDNKYNINTNTSQNDEQNNNCNNVLHILKPLEINVDYINKEDDQNNTIINKENSDIRQVIKACANFLDHFEGSGIFNIMSNVNHSCEPNAGVQILDWNNQATLVALKRIEKGEEIYISYIDNCEEGYEARQKELFEYQFVCDCEKCEGDRQNMTKKRKIKK